LGLTFLNAGLLFAALAALLPLLIHLISRRRVETVDFSSLRFLRELERKRIRRVRLRQILLLIVRSLIILMVALAIARPTIRGARAGGASAHAKTSIAIVLDDSASMSRDAGAGDLFGEARARAHEIASLLGEGDQAFLVTSGDPPLAALSEGTFSRSAFIEALDGVEVSASATDYSAAIARAFEAVAGARNINREVYVVGDLQRTGWGSGAAATEPGAPESPAAGGASPGARLYLLRVSGGEANLSCRSVTVSRKYGGRAGLFTVAAEVHNARRTAASVPVRLFVDGEQVGQAGVEAEPGEVAVTRFTVDVDESEWHAGWIELPSDLLDADNRRFFVIPKAERTEVLVVRADEDEGKDDAYYIERALDPTASGDRFRPIVISASSLPAQDPRRFPVAVLADVGRMEADAEAWVDRYLSAGGALVVVLGSRTDIRYWNANLLPNLTGARIRAPLDDERGARLAPSSRGHPILEGLVVGDRLIDDVSVRRGFEVDAGDAEEVLELPGIGPALILGRRGAGAGVTALFTGVDPDWSDLPKSGILVPLIHRLVSRPHAGSARRYQVVVGEELFVPRDPALTGRLEVTLPDSSRVIPELLESGVHGAVVRDTRLPGIYVFTSGGEIAALGAVNTSPRESNLASATTREIDEIMAGIDHRFIDPDAPLETEILESRHGRELWRVFVYAVLLLMALEMVLARPRLA
jgi:hypothetical protein